MATLSVIQSEITAKLSDGNLQAPTQAQIVTAINDAIDYYNSAKLWFQQGYTPITLMVGNPVVPNLPADFGTPWEQNACVIAYQSVNYPVSKVTNLQYDTANLAGKGIPFVYTWRDEQLLLYFFPDQAYTLNLTYRVAVPDLVNASDTNVFSINAKRLVIAKTLSDIYYGYRRDNEQGDMWEVKTSKELAQLLKVQKQLVATGTLTTENIIDRRNYYLGDYR